MDEEKYIKWLDQKEWYPMVTFKSDQGETEPPKFHMKNIQQYIKTTTRNTGEEHMISNHGIWCNNP